jgi:hypothetical protein
MTDSDFVFISDDGKTMISNFIEMFLKFGILTLFLTINLCAVSIALMCNKNEAIITKIFISIYAFLFGIIYILINYYSYRILSKNQTCTYENQVFPF